MDYLLLILLVLGFIALLLFKIWLLLLLRRNMARRPNLTVAQREHEKQKNLELVMALFEKHPKVTNMLVRQELGFDDRVIVRYMDELEKQGRVKQVGEVGKYAHYTLP